MKPISFILSRKTFFLTIAFGLSKSVISQCTSSGAQNASAFISQSFSGSDYAWSNPSNAASSDNNRATASAIISVSSGETDYIKTTGFGFGLSSFAAICGIEVQIEKSGSNIGGLASIQDYEVKLVKNNIVTGSNKATGTDWTSTDSYSTYGSSSDLWGTTWSYSDINNANFGVAIAAQISRTLGVFPSARIDHVLITVYYNIVLPVYLVSFNAQAIGKNVQLQWEAAESYDRTNFVVQRSADGNSWNNIGNIFSESQAANNHSYQFTDPQPLAEAYYRLKIVTASASEKYSPVKRVKLQQQDQIKISPNPAKNKIVISGPLNFPAEIKVYNVSGNLVLKQKTRERSEGIDISLLKPGLYYAMAEERELNRRMAVPFIKSE